MSTAISIQAMDLTSNIAYTSNWIVPMSARSAVFDLNEFVQRTMVKRTPAYYWLGRDAEAA